MCAQEWKIVAHIPWSIGLDFFFFFCLREVSVCFVQLYPLKSLCGFWKPTILQRTIFQASSYCRVMRHGSSWYWFISEALCLILLAYLRYNCSYYCDLNIEQIIHNFKTVAWSFLHFVWSLLCEANQRWSKLWVHY